MTTNKIISISDARKGINFLDGTVSTALLDRLTARIARREGRIKYRSADKWAKKIEAVNFPPAA